jgi:hypothetical protein
MAAQNDFKVAWIGGQHLSEEKRSASTNVQNEVIKAAL